MDDLIDILTDLGFEVQVTSYERLIENPELRELGSLTLPENDAASILRYFPSLFVMHRSASPLFGALFVVLREEGRPIPEVAQKVYREYFPDRILVVSKDSNNNYHAEWFHEPGKTRPLTTLLKRELDLSG